MSSNYDDVLAQLQLAGLKVKSIEVGTIKPVKCFVEGDRERRGWYKISEVLTKSGKPILVGSYGIWRGADQGTVRISTEASEFSPEQLQRIKAKYAEDRRQAELERKRSAERAAAIARRDWDRCSNEGDSPYLIRKGVGAHGVRFSPSGALVIPVIDVSGGLHCLQIIGGKAAVQRGIDKQFYPAGGAVQGHFHMIGMPIPGGVGLISEGYATAASLHEATGLPSVVAWHAGNLGAVSSALTKRYGDTRWLIAADDDCFQKCINRECAARFDLRDHPETCPVCEQPHRRSNAGVSEASTAALGDRVAWTIPVFSDEDARRAQWFEKGKKLTDFNDLHQAERLDVVRTQIEATLRQLGWWTTAKARGTTTTTGGAGGDGPEIKPFDSVQNLHERFCLVYGLNGHAFDLVKRMLVSLGDLKEACVNGRVYDAWRNSPGRRIVDLKVVGFDPTERDESIVCNMWGGWPSTPKAGNCEKLLQMLRHLCSGDMRADDLYDWLLRWCAYPIQHPGAKMKSCVVVHGPQGTGKSMFFEALLSIYREYGGILDQEALEDRFNEWQSKKMFVLADEVVARTEIYHLKNRLKKWITSDTVRVNLKNKPAYEEKNHANIVFLSNESMPVVLEEDDRRHAIIWTPRTMPERFYAEVAREIREGGAAALHHHLLHLDLGDFTPDTKPIWTSAKESLIELSLDSTTRFFYDWQSGELGVGYRPSLSQSIYDLYRIYCTRSGMLRQMAPLPKLVDALRRRHSMQWARKRYRKGQTVVGPASVLIPEGFVPAPEKSEVTWLTDEIDKFHAEFDEYKGRSGA